MSAGYPAPTYVVNRNSEDNAYSVWQFDISNPALFTQVPVNPNATFPNSAHLCTVGNYMMSYTPAAGEKPKIDYQVFEFDPGNHDPLNADPVQAGQWDQSKFLGYFNHYTWNQDTSNILQLVPMTGYVLAYMPTAARGTYCLWNFDAAPVTPGALDPLPNAITPQDAFALIGDGSELLPIGNYVLEWRPADSNYRVWSFDPQEMTPLQLPVMSEGTLADIDASHKLLVIGEQLLDWVPETQRYRLWGFDPSSQNPLCGPIQSGTLPDCFAPDSILTTVQNLIPVDPANAGTPGNMDFMRDKIEHVVVYMLESRSMDSVLGWLYENNPPEINYIDAEPPFKGASTSNSNEGNGEIFYTYQFENGQLSTAYDLTAPTIDPFHGTPDSIHQQYASGYEGYFAGAAPDMSGFVANNCSGEVMVTLSTTQLPVLNGLANQFAVSDYWFSALPGGTDSNRAVALTGSTFNITTTYEGDPEYEYFPDDARRQSIWKVLWNNGITDWKIYWAVKWYDYIFTYQLYLDGQIPTVDAEIKAGGTDYLAPIEQFISDAQTGNLPAFSFLEPAWIAPNGSTSYHPGGDLVPPEVQLNKIYEAVQGPLWEKTALLITFSKGGGLYDHEPPPGTVNPWPKDVNDGFRYDVLGPRVPAIVVSPWVKPHTVFRSPGESPLNASSIAATVLDWFGIPRARWGLGDRVPVTETFEAVFQERSPRADKPSFNIPYDKTNPPKTKEDS
jgi:phospholipase C